jgi:asparagine synthase (glutamine-hydrolysing)
MIAARLRGGVETLDSWLGGHFSIVHINLHNFRALFVTDRFAVFPICYAVGVIVLLWRPCRRGSGQDRQLDAQSIYDYIYFHVIPAPRTIFGEVSRMEAATRLRFDARGCRATRWWRPLFAADPGFRLRDAGEEFRGLLRSAVEGSMRSDNVGAYLSGGR